MADTQLRDVIDNLRSRLQTELEAELATLADSHEEALDAARHEAAARVEQQWADRLASVHADWQERLQREVGEACDEAQRHTADEVAQARRDAEQRMAEEVVQARAEAEQRMAAEVARARAEVEERLVAGVADTRAEAERRMAVEVAEARAEVERRMSAEAGEARAETERRMAVEVAEARAEAERRMTAEIADARAEAERRMEAEVAEACAEADRRVAAEVAQARGDAEQRMAAGIAEARAEAERRMAAEIADARTDAEHRVVAESMRARVDAEQAAAEAAASLRREMEQALADERTKSRHAIDAERARAERALADARGMLEAERRRTTEAFETARQGSESLDSPRLAAALRAIDGATTLTGIIRAVVRAAAAEAPRATLLIVNGPQLDEWTAPDIPSLAAGTMRVDGREAGFLNAVLQRGEPVASGAGLLAPFFAGLPPDRRAYAVPFMLGGQPVAVLYADEGKTGEARSGWMDAVQILGRYAAAAASCITAQRTLDTIRPAGEPRARTGFAASSPEEGEQGARRYARLLVSEIKLYNEAAVRTGRQMRDLSSRLQPEIARARRLYDERVSSALAARDMYFQHELIQTLADGDPSLLG